MNGQQLFIEIVASFKRNGLSHEDAVMAITWSYGQGVVESPPQEQERAIKTETADRNNNLRTWLIDYMTGLTPSDLGRISLRSRIDIVDRRTNPENVAAIMGKLESSISPYTLPEFAKVLIELFPRLGENTKLQQLIRDYKPSRW